ncbi:OLC1v1012498C1 [Oldenlandia corymbosa var. corymbosa]|uniref:OLC1v1012498C1 n=1 Tax=Oldenlandia corymbosa var. corymbosa TaxID=529605 RepID=A0AAV1DWA1_OLDCO|nr:OLC1v1012498C1 [Oldenlandia corymbosa var. corymbosa]
MAEAVMNFTVIKPHVHGTFCPQQATKADYLSPFTKALRPDPATVFTNGRKLVFQGKRANSALCKVNAFPDWAPLMAVMVEHAEGQRDLITNKFIWHLSDKAIKNVYTFYIMFTVWGCCFFSATKVSFSGITCFFIFHSLKKHD